MVGAGGEVGEEEAREVGAAGEVRAGRRGRVGEEETGDAGGGEERGGVAVGSAGGRSGAQFLRRDGTTAAAV